MKAIYCVIGNSKELAGDYKSNVVVLYKIYINSAGHMSYFYT